MQGGGKKEGTIMVARDTNFGSLANMVFFCSTGMFLYSSHRDTGFGAGAHAVFCMRVRLSEGLRV